MTAEANVNRLWWAGVLAIMASCLSLAIADLPLYRGAPLSLSLFGGLVAAAGFMARRLCEGMQARRRRVVDLAIPVVLAAALALVGSALPGAAVPIVWAVPLALLVWNGAGSVAADLASVDRTSDGEVVASTVSRLGGHVLLGLILLFLLVSVGSGRLAYLAAGLYVVTGVSSLAWLQYSVRRRQWARGGAQVRGRLGRHWLLSALALFAVVAVLAALTPTGVLLAVANAVWHALGPTLAQPVLSVIGQTSTHYHVIRGGGFGKDRHYGRGKLPKHFHHRHIAGPVGSNAWFLLWIVVAALLVYLGQAYWRHRFHRVPWRVALLGPLLAAWGRLRFMLGWSLDVANVHLPDQLAVLLAGSGSAVPGVSRRRFGRLSPRERIGLYYLGVVHRARRCGIPCPPWTTPREYVVVLGPNVGDAQGNFAGLSDVFVEARYSLHDVSDKQADQARADARRVRGALRDVQEPVPPTSPGSVQQSLPGKG